MTEALSVRGASVLWILLLTAASTVTTLVLACATPFPALAALAAVHMQRRDGLALMLLAWAASQAVGFCLLDYPHDAKTVAWGAGLATAAIGSALGAYAALGRLGRASVPVRLAAGYGAAFLAFKLIVLLWAFGLGGADTSLAPDIVARQFLRNGAILAGLFVLYHLLVAIGIPAARRRAAVA